MKNINKFLIVITILITFITTNVYAANISVLDVDSIEKVPYGTVMDSKYSFELKYTENTKVRVWQLDENNKEINYRGKVKEVIVDKDGNEKDYDGVSNYTDSHYLSIYPKDKNLSGKIGAWFYNVGNYKGNNVDVKFTFYWKSFDIEGYGEVNPTITFGTIRKGNQASVNSSGIGFELSRVSYEVKGELYSNGKKISADSNINLSDIDNREIFGFSSNNIHKIMTLEDDGNNDKPYYMEAGEYKVFYSSKNGTQSVVSASAGVRLEIDNLSEFKLLLNHSYDTENYGIDAYGYDNNRYRTATRNLLELDEIFEIESIKDMTTKQRQLLFYPALIVLSSMPYGPYDLPAPDKFVVDNSGNLSKTNMVKYNQNFDYNIFQRVPNENEESYYDSWEVVDNLPNTLSYVNAKVYNDAGIDVTNKFNISNNSGKITVSVKDPKSSEFYNNNYNVKITVKSKTGDDIVIKNDAKVNVKIGSSTIEKKSNNVETRVAPFNIVTKVLNGKIDNSLELRYNESATIKYSPNEDYKLIRILVDGEEVDLDKYKNSYSFNNVENDHLIEVEYRKEFYIKTEVENGTITPGDSVIVYDGDSLVVKYEPIKGYGLEKIIVDGKEIDTNGHKVEYKFENVNDNHTIKVVYTELVNAKTGQIGVASLLVLLAVGYYLFKEVKKKDKLVNQ